MSKFEYVYKKDSQWIKKQIIDFIILLQHKLKNYFTFQFNFIGSASRNMITREIGSNKGYDFDVDLKINFKKNKRILADKLKQKIIDAIIALINTGKIQCFNKFPENSKSVITMKHVDRKNYEIFFSCDLAIVYDDDNGEQKYIYFDKEQNQYFTHFMPKDYDDLKTKVKIIKRSENHSKLWQEVRELYLKKKNENLDPNKKSRSLYVETINEIYDKYF